MLKFFYVSATATAVGLATALYYASWEGMLLTAILSVLEVCLSFENAIVNASVLKDMTAKWRQRFLTWGIIIAVFGMRLVFPLVLVSTMTELNPLQVLDLALEKPDEYAAYLHASHATISAFGGMFLLMVFLEFLFDHKREIHWLGMIERQIAKLGNVEAIGIVLALMVLLFVQSLVDVGERASILVAGVWGLSIYVFIHGLASSMNKTMQAKSGRAIKRAGAMSFIYLELLDASFSFDGVIGAFAITKDIVIIMLGLGIGAFFVRSLTIMLVQKGTLLKYVFLEHGAYYALGSLSIMMLCGIYYEIPEFAIAGVGAVVILLAFVTSYKQLKLKHR